MIDIVLLISWFLRVLYNSWVSLFFITSKFYMQLLFQSSFFIRKGYFFRKYYFRAANL